MRLSEKHEDLERVAADVLAELQHAITKFLPFSSSHEGYAVILEELDELWHEVKNNGSLDKQRKEAIQVAAMGCRFVLYIDSELAFLERLRKTDREKNG